jgi:hypothetical protein
MKLSRLVIGGFTNRNGGELGCGMISVLGGGGRGGDTEVDEGINGL